MASDSGVSLDFSEPIITPSPELIRKFSDIPDLMTMEIPPIEYLVDGLISRGSMTLWAGTGGVAKSFLLQHMAVEVARGGKFLGRRCRQAPVLILDYENPAYVVRERLELLAGGPLPNLRVWGTWLEQQPPAIGSPVLLEIAKETRPLIIPDPLRYAHRAEENDSTEMAAVMQQLRYCTAKGAAAVIPHHLAKAEGSNSRGSSAIRDHVDAAFVQSMDAETGLISLMCDKNRFGQAYYSITVRPDFDQGIFEVTDSPQFARHSQELDALEKIISDHPGLTQNQICERSGMKRARVIHMLKEHVGTRWVVERRGQSLHYFSTEVRPSLLPVPAEGTGKGTRELVGGESTGSPVPTPIGGNRGTGASHPDSLVPRPGTDEDHLPPDDCDVGAMALVEARLRDGLPVEPHLEKQYREQWLPWLDRHKATRKAGTA